jgi:hypothetical protein
MAEMIGDSLISMSEAEARILAGMLREDARTASDYMKPLLFMFANALQRPQGRTINPLMFTVSVQPDRTPQ